MTLQPQVTLSQRAIPRPHLHPTARLCWSWRSRRSSGFHSSVWRAAKTLDARLREHDNQEVIPAQAGIQEPYIQSQAALGGLALRWGSADASPCTPDRYAPRVVHITALVGSYHYERHTVLFIILRAVSIHLCDTDAPPSMRLGRQSPLAAPLRHRGGASLARLLLSDSSWHGCRYARAVVPSSPRRRTMVLGFILWLLGIPRVVVILRGLLEFFSPAMPSDRTITGKSRRV